MHPKWIAILFFATFGLAIIGGWWIGSRVRRHAAPSSPAIVNDGDNPPLSHAPVVNEIPAFDAASQPVARPEKNGVEYAGTVVDWKTGQPVPGVTILLLDRVRHPVRDVVIRDRRISAADGSFRFSCLEKGYQPLMIYTRGMGAAQWSRCPTLDQFNLDLKSSVEDAKIAVRPCTGLYGTLVDETERRIVSPEIIVFELLRESKPSDQKEWITALSRLRIQVMLVANETGEFFLDCEMLYDIARDFKLPMTFPLELTGTARIPGYEPLNIEATIPGQGDLVALGELVVRRIADK